MPASELDRKLERIRQRVIEGELTLEQAEQKLKICFRFKRRPQLINERVAEEMISLRRAVARGAVEAFKARKRRKKILTECRRRLRQTEAVVLQGRCSLEEFENVLRDLLERVEEGKRPATRRSAEELKIIVQEKSERLARRVPAAQKRARKEAEKEAEEVERRRRFTEEREKARQSELARLGEDCSEYFAEYRVFVGESLTRQQERTIDVYSMCNLRDTGYKLIFVCDLPFYAYEVILAVLCLHDDCYEDAFRDALAELHLYFSLGEAAETHPVRRKFMAKWFSEIYDSCTKGIPTEEKISTMKLISDEILEIQRAFELPPLPMVLLD